MPLTVSMYLERFSFTRDTLQLADALDVPIELQEVFLQWYLFTENWTGIGVLARGSSTSLPDGASDQPVLTDARTMYNLVAHAVARDPGPAEVEILHTVLDKLETRPTGLPELAAECLWYAVQRGVGPLVSFFLPRAHTDGVQRVYEETYLRMGYFHEAQRAKGVFDHVINPYTPVVTFLLEHGKPDFEIWEPLKRVKLAMVGRDEPRVRALVQRFPVVVNQRDRHGDLLLEWCLRTFATDQPWLETFVGVLCRHRHYLSCAEENRVLELAPTAAFPLYAKIVACVGASGASQRTRDPVHLAIVQEASQLLKDDSDPPFDRLLSALAASPEHFLSPLDDSHNTLAHLILGQSGLLDRHPEAADFFRQWAWSAAHLVARNTSGTTVLELLLVQDTAFFRWLLVQNSAFRASLPVSLPAVTGSADIGTQRSDAFVANYQEAVAHALVFWGAPPAVAVPTALKDAISADYLPGEPVAKKRASSYAPLVFELAKLGVPSLHSLVPDPPGPAAPLRGWDLFLASEQFGPFLAPAAGPGALVTIPAPVRRPFGLEQPWDYLVYLSILPSYLRWAGELAKAEHTFRHRVSERELLADLPLERLYGSRAGAQGKTHLFSYLLHQRLWVLASRLLASFAVRRVGLVGELLGQVGSVPDGPAALPLDYAVAGYHAVRAIAAKSGDRYGHLGEDVQEAYACLKTLYAHLAAPTVPALDSVKTMTTQARVDFITTLPVAVSIYAQDAKGKTLLHHLVEVRDETAIQALLGNSARQPVYLDVHARWQEGAWPGYETPLDRAIEMEDVTIVELLLRAGADPNLMTVSSGTLQRCVPLQRINWHSGDRARALSACLVKYGASHVRADLPRTHGPISDDDFLYLRVSQGLPAPEAAPCHLRGVNTNLLVVAARARRSSLVLEMLDKLGPLDAVRDQSTLDVLLQLFHEAVRQDLVAVVGHLVGPGRSFLLYGYDSTYHVALHFVASPEMLALLDGALRICNLSVLHQAATSLNNVRVPPYMSALLRLWRTRRVDRKEYIQATGVVRRFADLLKDAPYYRNLVEVAASVLERVLSQTFTGERASGVDPMAALGLHHLVVRDPLCLFVYVPSNREVHSATGNPEEYIFLRYLVLFYGERYGQYLGTLLRLLPFIDQIDVSAPVCFEPLAEISPFD